MSIFETAIGWLAPADCLSCGREGQALCDRCMSYLKPHGERCWRCDKLSPSARTCEACRYYGPLKHVLICTSYESLAQELVRWYKFGHLRDAARPLARIMAKQARGSAIDWRNHLIVPVPTATSRARERGFAHSELLAKTIASELKIEYSLALRRLGQSRQLGAKREERLAQLADSFALRNNRVRGRKIVLVDDVLTTGGTLVAAAKILQSAGAKQVDALVFAKKL